MFVYVLNLSNISFVSSILSRKDSRTKTVFVLLITSKPFSCIADHLYALRRAFGTKWLHQGRVASGKVEDSHGMRRDSNGWVLATFCFWVVVCDILTPKKLKSHILCQVSHFAGKATFWVKIRFTAPSMLLVPYKPLCFTFSDFESFSYFTGQHSFRELALDDQALPFVGNKWLSLTSVTAVLRWVSCLVKRSTPVRLPDSEAARCASRYQLALAAC